VVWSISVICAASVFVFARVSGSSWRRRGDPFRFGRRGIGFGRRCSEPAEKTRPVEVGS